MKCVESLFFFVLFFFLSFIHIKIVVYIKVWKVVLNTRIYLFMYNLIFVGKGF